MRLPALAAALFALALPVAAGSAQTMLPPLRMDGAPSRLPRDFPLSVLHGMPAHGGIDAETVRRQSAGGRTIPLWRSAVASGGVTFNYVMVGKNPQTPLANPVSTVRVVIVPLRFTFRTGEVFDPSALDDRCLPQDTALNLVLASPVFQDMDLSIDGNDIGTGQFASLFQRASFADLTGPDGPNPGYAVELRPLVADVLDVPAFGGSVKPAPCGNLGLINLNTLDNYIQQTIFPQLKDTLRPTTFVVFLLYNIGMYQGNFFNCCTLGFHSSFFNPSHLNGFQTYSVVDFDSTNNFDGIADIATLSHEVPEWLDDPTSNNLAPSWGHVGQVNFCNRDFEVADPLTGTLFAVDMPNGFTYHVQDLAFFSWFFRQVPSTGANGLYSLQGTFTAPSLPCH